MDGVIYDFERNAALHAAEYFGWDEVPPVTTQWSMEKEWGITHGEWTKFFDWAIRRGVFGTGKQVRGAVNGMHALKQDGHRVRIVTAKPIDRWAMRDTVMWLFHNDVPYDALCFDAAKGDHPCDVAIDDKPSKSWMSGGLNILFDQPWNQGFHDGESGLTRASGWNSVLSDIEAHVYATTR